jgi:hypothetical protein
VEAQNDYLVALTFKAVGGEFARIAAFWVKS